MAVTMTVLKDHNEWLEHRKKFLGGSDASAIVNRNPWKSNVDLWLEKTGQVVPEDISEKPFVMFGHAAEPILRQLFQVNYPHYKVDYVDNNSWFNDKFPFAAASLDGWITDENGRKGILEIKTTEIVSSMAKEKWAGRLPDNYFVQVLHYLMVLEDCDFVHLTALLTFKFSEKELYQQIKNYHIERSEVLEDIQYLAEAEKEFWQQVQSGQKPPLMLPEI